MTCHRFKCSVRTSRAATCEARTAPSAPCISLPKASALSSDDVALKRLIPWSHLLEHHLKRVPPLLRPRQVRHKGPVRVRSAVSVNVKMHVTVNTYTIGTCRSYVPACNAYTIHTCGSYVPACNMKMHVMADAYPIRTCGLYDRLY